MRHFSRETIVPTYERRRWFLKTVNFISTFILFKFFSLETNFHFHYQKQVLLQVLGFFNYKSQMIRQNVKRDHCLRREDFSDFPLNTSLQQRTQTKQKSLCHNVGAQFQ